MAKKVLNVLIPLVIVTSLVVLGAWYFHHKSLFPSTEDAYVQANVVTISPRVSGKIEQVYVTENQHVQAGALLFTIDPAPYELAVAKAQANLEHIKEQIAAASMAAQTAKAKLQQAEAEYINTQLDARRVLTLVDRAVYSKSQGDAAVKDLKVAKANVQAASSQLQEALNQRGELGDNNAELKVAKTTLADAQLNLSYTQVRAPSSGYIQNFNLRQGAILSAYQNVFALVEDNSWWIEANFKETDLGRIRPGQTASITLDMYPNHQFVGKVQSLSTSSNTSFSILPPESAASNWVKVTQRFPIRVMITDTSNKRYLLRMGASSKVVIDTQTHHE